MSEICIKVEGSPGVECSVIIREMSQLASRMGVMVRAELNGVYVTAKPFCDPVQLAADWHDAMVSDRKYKFVCGQPASLVLVDSGKSESAT